MNKKIIFENLKKKKNFCLEDLENLILDNMRT